MSAGPYRVIVSDPPWSYRNSGAEGAAAKHYPTMTTADICALPVAPVAATDSVLFLWATWPCLVDAFAVLSAWGFTYKSGLPWIKCQSDPSPDLWGELHVKPQFGTGFWVRGCSEPLLIAVKGSPKPPSGSMVGLLSPNFGHSRKPENVYHLAETLPGPYLEMFARRSRDGWDLFGNQAPGSIELTKEPA